MKIKELQFLEAMLRDLYNHIDIIERRVKELKEELTNGKRI